MDQYQADLINRSIDGELTGQERVELEQLLADSSAARAFHDKMLLLQRLAREHSDVAAPRDLKSGVMAHINHAQAMPVRPGRFWSEVISAFRTVITPRVAYGVAAGVLIGFAVGAMTIKAGGDATGARATIGFSGTLGLPSSTGGLRHIDSDIHIGEDLSVHLIADRSDQHILVRVNLESEAKAELTFSYDAGLLEVQAFENDQARVEDASILHGKFHITHSGTGTSSVLFRVLGEGPESIVCLASAKGTQYAHEIKLVEGSD